MFIYTEQEGLQNLIKLLNGKRIAWSKLFTLGYYGNILTLLLGNRYVPWQFYDVGPYSKFLISFGSKKM